MQNICDIISDLRATHKKISLSEFKNMAGFSTMEQARNEMWSLFSRGEIDITPDLNIRVRKQQKDAAHSGNLYKYSIGQLVIRISGYGFVGTIVSAFTDTAGTVHYAVEYTTGSLKGVINIFEENYIVPYKASA